MAEANQDDKGVKEMDVGSLHKGKSKGKWSKGKGDAKGKGFGKGKGDGWKGGRGGKAGGRGGWKGGWKGDNKGKNESGQQCCAPCRLRPYSMTRQLRPGAPLWPETTPYRSPAVLRQALALLQVPGAANFGLKCIRAGH